MFGCVVQSVGRTATKGVVELPLEKSQTPTITVSLAKCVYICVCVFGFGVRSEGANWHKGLIELPLEMTRTPTT